MFKKYYFFGFIFLLFNHFFVDAQYSCGSGINITDGYTVTGITSTGNNGFEDWVDSATTCSASTSYFTADDVYLFTFTTASIAPSNFSMTVDSNRTWTAMMLFTSCSGASISGCIDDDSNGSSTGILNVSSTSLSANTTYYVAVGQWGSPNDLNFDVTNVTLTYPCTAPTATYTVVPNCVSNFSIDVDVTSLGTGTAVDISDAGLTGGITNVTTTGIQTMGPYAPGTNVVITVDGSSYSGCAASPSSTLTEDCSCTTTPIATVNSTNLDCGLGTYDIEVTVTNDGDGDANMTDILIDGMIVQADATVGQLYTFNRPVNSYTVTLEAESTSFVSCTSIDYNVSETCTNFDCGTAFNVIVDGAAVTSSPLPTSSTTYEPTTCDSFGNEETWFSFVAPASGIVLFTVDNYNDPSTNLEYGLFSGSCGSLTEVSCGSGSTATPYDNEVFSELTPGATYYIELSQDTGSGTEVFDVSLTNPVTTIAANTQTCWDLSTATPNLFDLGDAGDDYDCGFGFLFSSNNRRQIGYLYTPASNETVDIVLDNVVSATETFALGIFDNTVGTPVACVDGIETDTDTTISNVSLTGGTQYLIIIGGQTTTQNSTGCITISQQCNTTYALTRPVQNCAGNTYTSRLNFSSLGSIGTTVNLSNGTTSYTNISTGVDYDFVASSTADQTITITGLDGASMVVCEETVVATSGCNGSETCNSAVDITNICSPGDLNGAVVDGGALVENFISCGNGNTIALCGANPTFTGSSYTRTDHADIWYSVFPNGSNTVTINISNLSGGNLMVLPYLSNGSCPSTASDNATLEGHIGNSGITAGNCPYFSSDGSLVLSGADVANASIIYLRIMAYANNGSGATNCEILTYPTFDICTTVPQPNDVCSNAIDITTNNGGAAIIGDLNAAATDNSDEVDCSNSIVTEGDLWYEINYPSSGGPWHTELTLDGTTSQQVIVGLSSVTTSCGGYDPTTSDREVCEVLTFASPVTTTFGDITTSNGFSRYVQIIGVGSVDPVTVSAKVVAANNNCAGTATSSNFEIKSNPRTANFTFATDSGVDPITAGNDLWYEFDPDGSFQSYSTTVEMTIGGLSGDQEVTLILYKGDDCNNFTNDYIATEVFTADDTKEITCLDELHGPTDGGYKVRLIQTAGSTTATNVSIQAFPNPGGPFNNDAENIWDPNPLTMSGSTAIGAEAYELEDNTTFDISRVINSSFENATDCHPDISNTCASTPSSEVNDRDVWFTFQLGSSAAGTCDLSQSVLSSVELYYDSGSSFRDGIISVYDDVDGDRITSSDMIACSGSINGNDNSAGYNTPFTVSNLTQGRYYAVRVEPDPLNSDSEYAFTMEMLNVPASPCNDDANDAFDLGSSSYISGSNYGSGCTEGNALGAVDGNVWFQFIAEDNADEEGYVSIYLESLSSGGGNPYGLTINVYNEIGGSNIGNASTNSFGDGWLHLGQLIPGEDYFIEIVHSQSSTTDVEYKLCLYDNPTTTISCPSNSLSLTPTDGGQCTNASDCALYYRVELPPNAPSGWYYFEARSNSGINLDIRLFPQGAIGATEGNPEDYDHPCNPSPASMQTGTVGAQGTILSADYTSCPGSGNGEWATYNLIGSSGSESLYYYLEVRDDINTVDCGLTAADICSITIVGPFTDQLTAEGYYSSPTNPDGNCATSGPCTKPPLLAGTPTKSLTGVSTMQTNTPWPSGLNNAILAIESKEKGFVITRMADPETTIGANAVKGMLVYDTDDNCFKMYDGNAWGCITQGCPD